MRATTTVEPVELETAAKPFADATANPPHLSPGGPSVPIRIVGPKHAIPDDRVNDEPLPTSLAKRPRGHVVGHALGERLVASLAGRPHGHVVGHAIGERLVASLAGRPHGHVVGHAIGEPLVASLAGRPHGHVVGRVQVEVI